MGLKEYRRKRDFERTPEPVPTKADESPSDLFVVQKHAATNHHYDLRLRVGDVLKSWAVPKGPSFDPREKRLAIEVEDHPVEYGSFEGTIPKGEYGGGTVMLWDRGRWRPEGSAAESLKKGMLKFQMEGERLKGRWMLVRTKRPAKQLQWLLVKERDSEAAPGIHSETFSTSVTTGRSMEEIASGAPARKTKEAQPESMSPARVKGAKKASMPERFKPQLAESALQAPEGNEWLHEVKLDGYRLLIFRKADSVKIVSRNGLDWTKRLPDLARAVSERIHGDAVLDGEAVVLDNRGVSDFQALQNAIHNRRAKSIVFFAFDLLWCEGFDLTKATLENRRRILSRLIGPKQVGRLRLSEAVEGNGPAAFEHARSAGLEGIVSKRRTSTYTHARAPSWMKVKCFNQQDFVIGGLTAPEGSRDQFGALLLGYHDETGLRFAGKVGTGFSADTLKKLASQLKTLTVARPMFVNPPTGADARGVTWLRPMVVAQVQFREWTREGTIRHASFRGLREDMDPAQVKKEPTTVASGKKTASNQSDPKSPASRAVPTDSARSPLRLTHPERVVFPDRGGGYSVTKAQVAEYYEAVAPLMLPHMVDRPLAIVRLPSGEGAKAFFQKHPAKGMPSSIDSVNITDESGEATPHMVVRDVEGLMGLVQMNAIEFHPWGSRADSIEKPDRLIFDLDPGLGVPWKETVNAAILVRDALAQVKLRGFARTSGGKGIHIVVPIRPKHTWDEAKTFCKAVADTLVKIAPRRFTAGMALRGRTGKIFVDYLRNVRGATAVTSYSLRARPGAPVALPVAWDELEGVTSSAAFNCIAALKRLASGSPDPWRGIDEAAAPLQ